MHQNERNSKNETDLQLDLEVQHHHRRSENHGHHQGAQNDYDLDKYHGYDPQNRYVADNQHNLNLNVLPIDPVTETTIR